MNIRLVNIFLWLTTNTAVFGFDGDHTGISLHLHTGLIQLTTNDQLINYYNYAGNARLPFQISGTYANHKHLFLLNLTCFTSSLHPVNLTNNYYDYNYIQQEVVLFNAGYSHEITPINKNISVYIGLENSSFRIIQKEYYKNLLYTDAVGFRKSYLTAALNISPVLLVHLKFKCHNLSLKSGYSLLQYIQRPDDNFVKQTAIAGAGHWHLNWCQDYTDYQFSAEYDYVIYKGFGLSSNYTFFYQNNKSTDRYRYLQQTYLFGIVKSF